MPGNYTAIQEEGYFVSTDRALLDVVFIHNYIAGESYWAKNIPREILQTAIDNSLCFGVYDCERKQVGFARVVTDYATFGYLADVFIDAAHRGKQLSKFLMEAVMAHPQLQGLRRFSLATRDAHKLYEQFGFAPSKNPHYLMEIKKENPYPAP